MPKARSGYRSWSVLLRTHPEPHLVVGWTRHVNRWRDEGFFDLVAVRLSTGRYSVKRDFDEIRGQFLVLAAFEQENDARAVADAVGAETIARYPAYASQRGFKYGSKSGRALKAAISRGKTGKHLPGEPDGEPT